MEINEILKSLPALPGVYIMKGQPGPRGTILYIGKAKNLRTRVRSYFRKSSDTRYAAQFLAARVRDIDYIVTTNEKEALILEETLLKKHKPRYNIRLKDDKTYLSIKITTNEKFPRIFTTRRIKKDGARYFGPYTSAGMAKETIRFLRRIFALRVCGNSEYANRVRPCLDYQLGICAAPAVGLIDEEQYSEIVKGAIMFLEGKNRELVRNLKRQMHKASEELDFEKAARLRDRIGAIDASLEEQKVVSGDLRDRDVFSLLREVKQGNEKDNGHLVVQVLTIRDGRLIGSRGFTFPDNNFPEAEILSSFIPQYYRGDRFVPDEVLLSVRPLDASFLAEWLRDRKGRKVQVIKPVRGDKLRLVELSLINASETLKEKLRTEPKANELAEALKKRFRLRKAPQEIEAYDISNIGADFPVGAMVSFKDGEPDKDNYRRFKIKSVSGQDDYAMLFEVLKRRFSGELPHPDLVLIDGGKGQLSSAHRAFVELGLEDVELCSIAKDRPIYNNKGHKNKESNKKGAKESESGTKGERVFLLNVKDPILLKEGRQTDLYIRRIRDEVHRFVITYHRKLRSKNIGSVLEKIPGIGEKRRKALLKDFNDINGVRGASLAELSQVAGITEKLALEIKKALK